MKEHAKSLRRKRIGRPRPLTEAAAGARAAQNAELAPKVPGPGLALVRVRRSYQRSVPPRAADATRLETRTTEPLVPGETTARETPVSKGSRRSLEDRREVAPRRPKRNRDLPERLRAESGASNPIGSELRLTRTKPG